MRTERLIAAGMVALVILAVAALQSGMLNLGSISSTLVASGTGLEVPALDDPAMVRRGAAHYDRVCARCHASPDRPTQAADVELSPPPPKLHLRIEGWLPEVLFTTVKHGIKGTAMPAWPSEHRDDEVWSMVAFLRELPEMDAATYRSLAGLDTDTAGLSPFVTICARCHGAEGRGTPDGAFPRLDIQSPDYVLATLKAFRDGHRESGFMQSAVAGLSDGELSTLAEHFAGDSIIAFTSSPPSIATNGDPGRKIPACSGCHGPPDIARSDFPHLAGQYRAYLMAQLRLFSTDSAHRGGGPFAPLMHEAGEDLTEADIEAASTWYGGQSPADQ